MQLVLLIVASALMLLRPWRTPVWVGPAICASIGLATTAISARVAWASLSTLRNPLLSRRRYASVGVRVGLPALIVALAIALIW